MKLIKISNYCNLKFLIICSILFISLLCLFFIRNHSLIAHDESLYATRAKLILSTNNWFTPFKNPHHKTIGSYWAIALSFKINGINEFAARFPSYIFSCLSLLSLYKINKNLSNSKIAFLSIIVLSSTYIWFAYSHYASPDTLYIFLNLFGILNLVKFNKEINKNKKNRYLVFSGISFSLGFFIRSLLEFLPIICLVPFLFLLRKKISLENILFLLIGSFLGLIPLIINLLLAHNTYGHMALDKIIDLFNQKTIYEDDIFTDFTYYPRNLLIFLFPFSIFLINGSTYIYRTKSKQLIALFIHLPLINIGLLIFTASSYIHYALFSVPFLATNISYGIVDSLNKNSLISKFIAKLFTYLLLIMGISYVLIFIFKPIEGMNLIFNKLDYITGLIISIIFLIFAILIFDKNKFRKFTFYNLISLFLIQIFLMSFLFAKGVIGNPNRSFKNFIMTNKVQSIINKKNIYIVGTLYDKDEKFKYLLDFYVPKLKFVQLNELPKKKNSYVFIDDAYIDFLLKSKNNFNIVEEYKNINLVEILD